MEVTHKTKKSYTVVLSEAEAQWIYSQTKAPAGFKSETAAIRGARAGVQQALRQELIKK